MALLLVLHEYHTKCMESALSFAKLFQQIVIVLQVTMMMMVVIMGNG